MRLRRRRPNYQRIRRLEIELGLREPDEISFRPGAMFLVGDPREILLLWPDLPPSDASPTLQLPRSTG